MYRFFLIKRRSGGFILISQIYACAWDSSVVVVVVVVIILTVISKANFHNQSILAESSAIYM